MRGSRLGSAALLIIVPMCAVAVRPPQGVRKTVGVGERPALRLNFQDHPVGPLTEREIRRTWPNVGTMDLSDRIRVSEDSGGRHVLTVVYPRGGVGPKQSGGMVIWPLPPGDEYYLSYRVKLDEGFDFRKGGKLPGLGSEGCKFSGGRIPTKGEGWSARFVWGRQGDLSAYVYHAGMKGKWGDGVPVRARLTKGSWHSIVQQVRLNSGNAANGTLRVWVDGVLSLDRTDFQFRLGEQAPIAAFCFSTFHGGHTPDFAPLTTGTATFDDILVSSVAPTTLGGTEAQQSARP